MIEVACTATRNGLTSAQKEQVKQFLKFVHKEEGIGAHNNGGCIGGDEDIAEIIHKIDKTIPIYLHPGNLPQYYSVRVRELATVTFEPMDNILRNKVMVDRSGIVVAGPGEKTEVRRGSGTWATIRYARDKAKNKELWIFYPDGSSEWHNG